MQIHNRDGITSKAAHEAYRNPFRELVNSCANGQRDQQRDNQIQQQRVILLVFHIQAVADHSGTFKEQDKSA
ncbi:hypothetical protein D3C72_2228170 [compost metagenome]